MLQEGFYDKLIQSQNRCSGIDLVLMKIDDLTTVVDDDTSETFVERVRSAARGEDGLPITSCVDWDSLMNEIREKRLTVEQAANLIRESILKEAMEHGEFLDVFVPHLTRVPRDVDGKLIANLDAGCAPPTYILGNVEGFVPRVSSRSRSNAIDILKDRGFVTVKHAVDLGSIEKVREELNITTSFSGAKTKRFETRDTQPDQIFKGERADDVSYTQLASGRFSYQLRCSLLEKVVKPLHASVMPLVWEYLAKQRNDSLLNALLGDPVKKTIQKIPRVFLSSVSLICSDPLSGADSWHATNGGGGVVVLVPLSPFEERNGNTLVLPGTHKAWMGLRGIVSSAVTVLRSGGVYEIKADCGDAILMDGRLMRMTAKNELFNRSKVWLAFHYDFTDRPAPYQWLPRTLFMNALATAFVHMDNLYRKLPPLSHPNKLE